jgi:hypothetical protein
MDFFIGANRSKRAKRFAAAGMLFFDGQLRRDKFAAGMRAPNPRARKIGFQPVSAAEHPAWRLGV